MKIEKLSMQDIKNVLSRNELKSIMAGSGGGCGCELPIGQNLCCQCLPGVDYHLFCRLTDPPMGDCSGFCESLGLGQDAATVDCSFCS
jgi:hypothetical protein